MWFIIFAFIFSFSMVLDIRPTIEKSLWKKGENADSFTCFINLSKIYAKIHIQRLEVTNGNGSMKKIVKQSNLKVMN